MMHVLFQIKKWTVKRKKKKDVPFEKDDSLNDALCFVCRIVLGNDTKSDSFGHFFSC